MSDVVIRAEGLGKKYLIGHNAEHERYVALRDVVARTAKGFVRSARDILQGRQLVAGDEIEEFWALKDINFEIKRGDVVGIIGRNGAGKSTLLKILSRITEPSTGRVEIKGRVASLLEVGTGFHPELSGRENIYLNGAILGMSRAEIKRKFDEIVAFAEVERFLDTPVKHYSSGMYVRLAFAVAAHLEPEILIVDEVLAVGDAAFQAKCLGKMGEVAGEGRTVLLVSHNVGAIRRLCQFGILLDHGKMLARANMEACVSLYSETVHDFVSDSADISTNLRPRQCDHGIEIQRITLIGLPILQDGPLEARVELRTDTALNDVVFGVGFCDIDGRRLLSSDSDYVNPSYFSFPQSGTYCLNMRIPQVSLSPAKYLLDIGCRLATGKMLDNIAGALLLTILPSASSIAVHYSGYRTALTPANWNRSASVNHKDDWIERE